MSHRLSGWQVRPDQTKVIKGQSGKTLATAGTINGPLPCPEKRIEKQSIHGVKRKQKRKKIRKKTEKKREEIEEKRKIVQWACTSRSVSLSTPSNPALFQNVTRIPFGQ